MAEAPKPVNLAGLDAVRPHALLPEVWERNLAALEAAQPDLAELLRAAAVPPHWRPALGLDDTPTYRLEPLGMPPDWLGGTAAPRVRAENLLKPFVVTGQNVALAEIGAGLELQLLLERLPPHLAVFVFSAEPARLAAVLRLLSFDVAIRAGRCRLLPPREEMAYLERLLAAHPGLMPPGNIVLPDLAPPERRDGIRAACERMADVLQRRHARIQELAREPAPPPGPADAPPRLALLSLSPDVSRHVVGQDLADAAHALGWPVLLRHGTEPAFAHPLTHAEALAEFRPSLTLCLQHAADVLPPALLGQAVVWLTQAPAPAETNRTNATLLLAASPAVREALTSGGVAEAGLADWFWACRADVPERPWSETARDVLLVADLPARDAAKHGVDQESHQRLWEQAREVVTRTWETPAAARPGQLLVQAERAAGVEITDAKLREFFERCIADAIRPAVLLEQLVRELEADGWRVSAAGRGWERIPSVRSAGADLRAWRAWLNATGPCACVCAGAREALHPLMLEAAARGGPLLVHHWAGTAADSLLGGVLQPQTHFDAFSDRKGLRSRLQLLRRQPDQVRRRMERARRHVLAHHTWAQRLRSLVDVLLRRAAP